MSEASRIARAALPAARMQAAQRRKGCDVPYVNHVLEVAALAGEVGGSGEEVIAALLHDRVEDAKLTLEQIAARFGPGAARLVRGLTDESDRAGLDRLERKARQAARVAREPGGVKRIKIADQTANLRDKARFPKGWSHKEAPEYIGAAEPVVAACGGVSPKPEAAFEAAAEAARAAMGDRP